MSSLADVVESALRTSDIDFESDRPGSFVVTLPGQRKLQTVAVLAIGAHAFTIEAFFMRRPDENAAELYKFLLSRNAKMYGVSFAVDKVGDVFIVGHLPLAAVTADEVDRVLGCVLTYADENFDRALEIGFASSIRREWAWRVSRGESLENLRAFASFADPSRHDAATS
ncbi:MAG: hypothetical protein QOK42_1092 [Frankiaceae bacterium]|nr:hypothetical protein [Frankiaceae bacterium]